MQDAGEKAEHVAEKHGRYLKNPDHTSRDKNKYLWYEKRHFLGLMENKCFKQISKFQTI